MVVAQMDTQNVTIDDSPETNAVLDVAALQSRLFRRKARRVLIASDDNGSLCIGLSGE